MGRHLSPFNTEANIKVCGRAGHLPVAPVCPHAALCPRRPTCPGKFHGPPARLLPWLPVYQRCCGDGRQGGVSLGRLFLGPPVKAPCIGCVTLSRARPLPGGLLGWFSSLPSLAPQALERSASPQPARKPACALMHHLFIRFSTTKLENTNCLLQESD